MVYYTGAAKRTLRVAASGWIPGARCEVRLHSARQMQPPNGRLDDAAKRSSESGDQRSTSRIDIAEAGNRLRRASGAYSLLVLDANKILPKERHRFARGIVRTRLVDAHDKGGEEVFSLRELPCPYLRWSARSEATEGLLGKAGIRKGAGAISITRGVTRRSAVLDPGGRNTGAPGPPRNRHNRAATNEGASFGHGRSWPHPRRDSTMKQATK